MRYRTFFIVFLLLILSSGYSQSANVVPEESPESFIRSLYSEHLSQYDKIYWFDNEKILSKYFDSKLTALFLRDEKCKKETQEICNLDFDPIIAAQDFDDKYPFGIEVRTLDAKSQTRYKVIISNINKRTLIYELRRTKRRWKIIDITYADGQSLKKLLSQKIILK